MLAQSQNTKRTLVTINGNKITQADLDFLVLSRRISTDIAKAHRKQLIEQLIDQHLLRQFLVRRKVKIPQTAVDAQIRRIAALIRRVGDDPKKVLARLGYTQDKLRQELGLPLMWKSYALSIITAAQIREHWKQHQVEFDGTEIRAAHIVLKLADPSDKQKVAEVTKKLKSIRERIATKKLSFAEAAKKFSESPTKEQGGDLGLFPFHGKMPVSITRPIFALADNEISQPFQTQFGMHIATITARRPGQLSLEDVRASVFEQLAEDVRKRLVKKERDAAKIQWSADSQD